MLDDVEDDVLVAKYDLEDAEEDELSGDDMVDIEVHVVSEDDALGGKGKALDLERDISHVESDETEVALHKILYFV
jgi:hypothetical protein